MATRAQTMNNQAKAVKSEKASIFKRLLWILLVGVIPVIVTVALIGTALQIIGLPVLQTTEGMLGISHQATVSTPIDQAKQDLATETAKERLDSSQILTLRQQLAQETQQIAQLTSQLNTIQSKNAAQVSLQDQAKKEAQVLSQMDPGQAANVLAKMPTQQAAATVAAFAPSDSGAILSQMSPKDASTLLTMAASVESASIQQSNSTADNATVGQ